MLAAIGVGSREELFERQIPQEVRLGRELALPRGRPEQEVYEHLRELVRQRLLASAHRHGHHGHESLLVQRAHPEHLLERHPDQPLLYELR